MPVIYPISIVPATPVYVVLTEQLEQMCDIYDQGVLNITSMTQQIEEHIHQQIVTLKFCRDVLDDAASTPQQRAKVCSGVEADKSSHAHLMQQL